MRKGMAGLALGLSVLLGAPSAMAQEAAAPQRLLLMCPGQFTIDGTIGTVNDSGVNPNTGSYEFKSRTISGDEVFGAEVRVEIADGKGRINVPSKAIPFLTPDPDDGWYELRELKMEPNQITGRYRMSMFIIPTVTINRLSGAISISGSQNFYGKCSPAAAKPLF